MRFAMLVTTLVAALLPGGEAVAFKTYSLAGGAIHGSISRKALVKSGPQINLACFKAIDNGNTSQDALGSSEFLNHSHHFDNCKIQESLAYIESCYGEIKPRLCLAGKHKEDYLFVLHKFGQLLHPLQDFYSHSNYVELQLSAHDNLTPDQVPLINWQKIPPLLQTGFFYFKANTNNEYFMGINPFTAGNPDRDRVTPYLVKAGSFRPGTRYATTAEYVQIKTFGERIKYVNNAKFSLMHRDINKDNDATEEGKIANPETGSTLFAYAENLAVRETARQWLRLESEVRQSCPDANRVLRVLRQGFK